MTSAEAASRNESRNAALEVLRTHWDWTSLPIDPIRIARAIGADVFTADLKDGVTGLITQQGQSGAEIFLSNTMSDARTRFVCAHELAVLMHGADGGTIDHVDYAYDSEKKDPIEDWANTFAAHLLMPEGKLRLMVDRGDSEIAIADAFRVSLPAAMYRLRLLDTP